MIVKNKVMLDFLSAVLLECNMKIIGKSHQINPKLLQSPFSGSDYEDDDKTEIIKITRRICKDHIFIDGNKRTALLMLQFLSDYCGFKLKPSDKELYDIMIHMTTSDEVDYPKLKTQLFK